MARYFRRNRYAGAFALGMGFDRMCRAFWGMGLSSPKALRLLLFCGLLSICFLAVPGIHILLLFTGIGIPLIPFVIVLPALVLIWCCILLFRLILPFKGRSNTIAAYVATALALFLPAQWLNNANYAQAVAVTAQDHSSATLPLHINTLAIVNRGYGSSGKCDRLCLHSLLNGTADTVIMHAAEISDALPDMEQTATAYSFEKRAFCPPVDLDRRHYVLPENGIPVLDRSLITPQRNAAELASQRIASGDCLVSRMALLSEADHVIALGPVKRTKPKHPGFGFDFKLNDMNVSRLNVYERRDGAGFTEVFRASSGTYHQFFHFLIPMASWAQDAPSGWIKVMRSISERDYSSQNKWDVFGTLEETLGLKLKLDGRNYRRNAQAAMEGILDANRAPTAAEWEAFEIYWRTLNFFGSGNAVIGPNARDAEIALRILKSPHMELPLRFKDFTRYAVRAGLIEESVLAKAMADREFRKREKP